MGSDSCRKSMKQGTRRRRLFAAAGLAALITGSGTSAHAGTFSDIIPWDEVPIHAALLPNGKVMTFGATPQDQQGGFDYTLWDPTMGTASNAFLQIPNGINFDTFCVGGILYSGDASIFLAGGRSNQAAAKYVYQNSSLALFNAFNYPRYYASLTTLPDGRVVVNGGAPSYGNQTNASTIPEIFNPGKGWTALTGASNSPMRQGDQVATGNPFWYPHQFYVGNNELFVIAGKYTYRLNYSGNGSVRDEKPYTNTNYGAGSTAVMYQPGKVLQIGGGDCGNYCSDGTPGSKIGTIFDLTTYPERRTDTTMALGRHMANSTVLANGEVLVTGGSSVLEDVSGADYQAEIYNPTTGQWRLDATMQIPRLYHSMAILLKDGRVLVGGGGLPGPVNGHNVEIYTPDYLLDANHVPAVRPSITAAPGRVALGQTFALSTDKPISRVTLVKTGVVTHSYNTDQRFFELKFTGANKQYNVTFPNDAVNATPGLYMVFAFDQNGVPSVGKFVRLPSPSNDDGSSVPNDLPTPTTPTGSGVNAGGWLDCAKEWGTCNVPGNASVRFGANGAWITQKAATAIACTNAAFGRDPAYGLLKFCQYQIANTAPYGGNGTAIWGQPGTGTGQSGSTNNATNTPNGTTAVQSALPIGTAAPLMPNHVNLCVAVQNDANANGTPIVTSGCNQAPGQSWKLVPQGVGYAVVNTLTNKCLDVDGWNTNDGGKVQIWDCTGGTNQTWMPTATANGISLVANHSGKCLDVSGISTTPGAIVWQWTCWGGANQAFHKPANTTPTPTPATGPLTVGAKISLQATTACCSSQYIAHQGTNVTLSNVNGATEQQNATWIVRAGLGKSSCVSFEAANAPGNFLRHSYFILYAGANDGSSGFAQDATFCPVAGLSGKGTSFQSINFPNKYIRHFYWKLYIASNGGTNPWDNPTPFNDDASWTVAAPLAP